ncbi:MAG: hypothetical protein HOM20_08265 [Porticoccaceae bacterium]|nr:hypothetical protein [Porticoccaceae bacterium]
MLKPKQLKTILAGTLSVALLTPASLAYSADWYLSGFVRQEGAFSLNNDKQNPWNQAGNAYNGVATPNTVEQAFGMEGMTTRPESYSKTNDWNVMFTRAELDLDVKFNDNLKFVGKVRALYAWDEHDTFNGDGPNYFETSLRGDCATRLEICGEDYAIDLPSFYLDYSDGPLWLRVGNQQIAWGESLFFRVLDNPNGLDLRRHSAFDWASEEFSDKRVPALGVRGSYSFKSDWEFEAWGQEFQPSVMSNENTPYNAITSTFVVQTEQGFDEVDDKWNFGARLRGQIGELGLQFTYTNRYNPDGVYRWAASGVNPFEKLGIADPVADPVSGVTTGQLLAMTPFEPFSGVGIYTAEQWMNEAAGSRLNGANLQGLLNDFPVAQALTNDVLGQLGLPANTPVDNYALSTTILDAFFSAPAGGLGDLRGHIERRYDREDIFGFGMNYMFFSEPDSFLDQLIVRFEATFTPNKTFTDPSLLGKGYLVEDELVTSFVMEKYHRFSVDFPATYMVFQWLHKSESDLFGRHLDGYGMTTTEDAGFTMPKGRNGYDAISFALQQPSPSLLWRADLAVLWDLEGGYLVQPGLRYKPSKSVSAELFANFVGGGDDNMDAMSTFDFVEEVAFRLTYQF